MYINWKGHSKKEGEKQPYTYIHTRARKHTHTHTQKHTQPALYTAHIRSLLAALQCAFRSQLNSCHFSKEAIEIGFSNTLDNWEYRQSKIEWREGGGFMKRME